MTHVQASRQGAAAGPVRRPGRMNLRAALEEVDVVPLAMSLIQSTGDRDLLRRLAEHIKGPWDYSQTLPPALVGEVRDRARDWLETPSTVREELSPDMLVGMLGVAVGEMVGADYVPLIRAQMQLDGPQPLSDGWQIPAGRAEDYRAVIVGAGVAGLCAAIHFEAAGIPYEVLEKNIDVGGTWLENTYPGCAVDTPNHFYQFSFEPNNDWSHYFSKRAANLEYLRHCARKFGVLSRVRFGTELVSATFDELRQIWRVVSRDASGAEVTRDVRLFVCAVGQLNRPVVPAIMGTESFAGRIAHTAAWGGTAVEGKRVGLIGTAASGVQLACAIAAEVSSLSIFQRSANWIVRNPNIHREVGYAKKWALDQVPHYAAWYRFLLFWGYADGLYPALVIDPAWEGGNNSINATSERLRNSMERYIRRELEGRPDLLEKSIPTFPPFGKRVLGDPGWFKMLKRDNVELVSTTIERIVPEGIVTRDGRTHELDVIALATGFQASKMLWPMKITGRGDASIRERWGEDDPRAYLGVTVADFPNMFVLYGPNTATGHGGSFTFLAECQAAYIMGCVRLLVDSEHRSIEPTAEAVDEYNRDLDERLAQFVWAHPSVNTWYKNKSGRITTNQPWKLIEYWQKTRTPEPSHYRLFK